MKHIIWILLACATLSFTGCQSSSDEESDTSGKKTEGQTGTIDETQDKKADTITGDDYEYQIPVIFHVLYDDAKNTKTYISATRLKQLIDNVNKIYAGSFSFDQYTTWMQQTPSFEYTGNSTNIHVKFVLATKDEDGNTLSTPGVDYRLVGKDKEKLPWDCEEFMNDNNRTYTEYLWDPNDYINIMVYPFLSDSESGGIILGISNMPYRYNGLPAIEGLQESKVAYIQKKNLPYAHCISINSLYINEQCDYFDEGFFDSQQAGFSHFSTADANITLGHELGHYLGLFHDFSETTTDEGTETADNDIDSDYCTDTKSHNRNKYNEWFSQYQEDQVAKGEKSLDLDTCLIRSNSRGETWKSVNIMDYSVTMGYYLTPQQCNRIRQVLYYSPLIPGPKKTRATRAANAIEGDINLPRRIVKCTMDLKTKKTSTTLIKK